MHPRWTPDGNLLFISDKTNWWNLYLYDSQTGNQQNLCQRDTEIGEAQKKFGNDHFSYDQSGSGQVVVTYGQVSLIFPLTTVLFM